MKFECHITTNTQHAEAATDIAKAMHWKTSEIARDPVLGDATYFYLTSHGATYKHIKDRMDACASALTEAGAPVIRMKIEEIIYDTKLGLTGPTE